MKLVDPIGMDSLYLCPWLKCQGLETKERDDTIVSYPYFVVL